MRTLIDKLELNKIEAGDILNPYMVWAMERKDQSLTHLLCCDIFEEIVETGDHATMLVTMTQEKPERGYYLEVKYVEQDVDDVPCGCCPGFVYRYSSKAQWSKYYITLPGLDKYMNNIGVETGDMIYYVSFDFGEARDESEAADS
jgi:hypothetical protein